MQIIKISEYDAGKRLDKFLFKYFDSAPKSFVYKNLRKKNIKLGGKKALGSENLKFGDEIELFFSEDTLISLSSSAARAFTANYSETSKPIKRNTYDLKKYCTVIYEDANLIIADKPAGILSQKASPKDISINDVLIDYVLNKHGDETSKEPMAFTPSICNRLDRNTSGLIIFAKTYAAAKEVNRLIKERLSEKTYLALVFGILKEKSTVRAWLIKDSKSNTAKIFDKEIEGSSMIVTSYGPVRSGSYNGIPVTLLKVGLITGKTHQIRAHLSAIGHPVIGDPKYAKQMSGLPKMNIPRYQLLHSSSFTFPLDTGSPIEYLASKSFEAPLPEYFQNALKISGIKY